MDDVVNVCREKMQKRLSALSEELQHIRTGRASVGLLDKITVRYYGTNTPIVQVATISAPDPKTLVISPFEKKSMPDIEKAIMAANLGLQPSNDGNVIRVSVPPLTEDRRLELVKKVKKMGEDCKVAIRLVRREFNDKIKKNKELAEDESKKIQKDVQKETDNYIVSVDQQINKKEQDILTI